MVSEIEAAGGETDADVTSEDIAAHWDQVRATEGFTEVPHALAAMAPLQKLRGS